MEDNIDNNNQLCRDGGRGFAVHASVDGKVQAEPPVNPNRRKEEERCLFSPFLGCLATYVGCVLCASLSRLGVVSTPPK